MEMLMCRIVSATVGTWHETRLLHVGNVEVRFPCNAVAILEPIPK